MDYASIQELAQKPGRSTTIPKDVYKVLTYIGFTKYIQSIVSARKYVVKLIEEASVKPIPKRSPPPASKPFQLLYRLEYDDSHVLDVPDNKEVLPPPENTLDLTLGTTLATIREKMHHK
jgi:hypothetical protein